MKSKGLSGVAVLVVCISTCIGATFADGLAPIPISADQAFDAVTMHRDPETGDRANVVLIDVRDPVEYFFNGAAGAVTKITLKDKRGNKTEIRPDYGKVRLIDSGKFAEYSVRGRYQRVQVGTIAELGIEPIAYAIPLWRYNNGWGTEDERADEQEEFYDAMIDFASSFPDAGSLSKCGSHKCSHDKAIPRKVILYCRTGGRSSTAGSLIMERGLFSPDDVYEIDDPGGQNGRGGFSGPAWSDKSTDYNGYNGYAGFPGRQTPADRTSGVHASVSWLDSGLPVVTTVKPLP